MRSPRLQRCSNRRYEFTLLGTINKKCRYESFCQIDNRISGADIYYIYDDGIRHRRFLLYARTVCGHIVGFCEIAAHNKAMDEDAEDDPENEDKPEDEEISRLMEEHDIDEDVAEKAQELIDEGLDEDDAVDLAEEA